MDFELNEEQLMFRDMARRFALQHMLPIIKNCMREERFDSGLFRLFAEAGLLAPHMPSEYGGLGLDYLTSAIIWEELSKTSLAMTQAVTSGPIQPGTNLLDAGSEEQKQKWLPPVCRGEVIFAGAVVEPNAGSDSSRTETTAVKMEDGWLINGNKIFITNGAEADLVIFTAQLDKSRGSRGIGSFLVEKGTSGFSQTPQHGKLSWRAGSEGTLRFADCKLPFENQVSQAGAGLRDALRGIDTARLLLAAGSVGVSQSCLEASIEYAKQRVQFGKPIGGHQLIQGTIAEMAAKTEASRWLTYRVADMKTKGKSHIKEMSYAKWFSSETALWVAAQAVKIHGSFGTFDDYPVGRHYQDVITTTILGGTAEIHKLTIGRQLLDIAAFE
jgi:alkylation response protein AidB-like acyl-CoA dehydrogenase